MKTFLGKTKLPVSSSLPSDERLTESQANVIWPIPRASKPPAGQAAMGILRPKDHRWTYNASSHQSDQTNTLRSAPILRRMIGKCKTRDEKDRSQKELATGSFTILEQKWTGLPALKDTAMWIYISFNFEHDSARQQRPWERMSRHSGVTARTLAVQEE